MKGKLLNFMLCMCLICGSLCAIYDGLDDTGVAVESKGGSDFEYLRFYEEQIGGIGQEDLQVFFDEDELTHAGEFKVVHKGANHYPHAVTPFGDIVELEDGSRWLVKENERYKALNWHVTDLLVITPNSKWFTNWFTQYDYRLQNMNTGAVVQVRMFEAPIYNGKYAHWIVDLDLPRSEVCLDDGSVWNISGFDKSILDKWNINDTIIIGTEEGIFSYFFQNILINASIDSVSYVRAKCIHVDDLGHFN